MQCVAYVVSCHIGKTKSGSSSMISSITYQQAVTVSSHNVNSSFIIEEDKQIKKLLESSAIRVTFLCK